MEKSKAQADFLNEVKSLQTKLEGRRPLSKEISGFIPNGKEKLAKLFGNYQGLGRALGWDSPDVTEKRERKLLSEYKKICAKVEKLESFTRHTINLEELFSQAGNPPSIKVMGLFDVHSKFRDPAAWSVAIQFARHYRPHVKILGGDFIDAEGISHWPPDSLQPRRLVPECKIARELMGELEQASQESVLNVYLEGNHERWVSEALLKMPELFEDLSDLGIEISLRTLLALDKFNYSLIPLNELLQIGRSHWTHGVYTTQNHARAHLQKYKANIFYGHLHDFQETNESGVEGHYEAACSGCLCRLDAKFLKGKINHWQHGFRVAEIFPDGSYVSHPIKIVGGRTSYGGVVFDGNKK